METIEVECQSSCCKNKVTVIANLPYFGILCSECMKGTVYTK